MDDRAVAYWRLRSLRLSGPGFAAPEDVVAWLGAVQAQDYGPAKWSVATRTPGLDDAALERAVADGAILRTHVLRPTWHFVNPRDIRAWLAVTGPRVHALNAYQYRTLGLDAGTLDRTSAVIAAALEGGQHLTRTELAVVLEEAGVAAEGLRLGYILMHAELEGLVCSGAPRGKQQTYALLEERAPRAGHPNPDEALAELTLRYFASHGPATVNDFKAWSSLKVADIKRGLGMVGDRLEQVQVGGLTHWFAEPAPSEPPPGPTVGLLQPYDEYFMGYRETRDVIDTAGVTRSPPEDAKIFNSVAILDSQVIGHWRRRLSARRVTVEVALYADLDAAQQRALQAECDRYGAFLGLPAQVVTSRL